VLIKMGSRAFPCCGCLVLVHGPGEFGTHCEVIVMAWDDRKSADLIYTYVPGDTYGWFGGLTESTFIADPKRIASAAEEVAACRQLCHNVHDWSRVYYGLYSLPACLVLA
jgi:hypothetical protein